MLRGVAGNKEFQREFPQLVKLTGNKRSKCGTCRYERAVATTKYSGPIFASLLSRMPLHKLNTFKRLVGATKIQITIGQTVKVL